MKRLHLTDVEDHISEDALRHGSRLVPAKTIFVVIRGMILAKELPVAMTEVPMAFNQDMKAVLARNEADPEYLLYALASRKHVLSREIGTSAHGTRRIGSSSLEALMLPLPPKREQVTIAAVLRKLEGAVEAQGRIVATLKELKAATLAKLFREGLHGEPLKQTEIGEIPESWEPVRLGSIAQLLSGGTPSKAHPEWWQGTIPWASPKDMKQSRLRDTQDHISSDAVESASQLVPAGTIFVVIRGMILTKDIPVARAEIPMAFNQDMKAIRPRNVVDGEYLLYAITSRKEALAKEIGTSAHGTRRMGTSSLEGLVLPLPGDRQEQRRIATALAELERREEVALRVRDVLRTTFSTMIHLLMAGQVRVAVGQSCNSRLADATTPHDRNGDTSSQQEPSTNIKESVTELVSRFDPDRVILFGPPATGSPRAFGDVGLLVEMPFRGMARDQAARIAREIPHDFSLDLLVRRPEELRRAREIGDRYLGGILERGRVLYARPPGAPARQPTEAEAPRRPPQVFSEETLQELVRQIVEAVQPEQIVLFGSAARGEMGPDSDVDLLVVKSCTDRRAVAQTIREHLLGVARGLPKDIVVVTPEDVERDRDTIGYIIRPAMREGRVVYAA